MIKDDIRELLDKILAGDEASSLEIMYCMKEKPTGHGVSPHGQ